MRPQPVSACCSIEIHLSRILVKTRQTDQYSPLGGVWRAGGVWHTTAADLHDCCVRGSPRCLHDCSPVNILTARPGAAQARRAGRVRDVLTLPCGPCCAHLTVMAPVSRCAHGSGISYELGPATQIDGTSNSESCRPRLVAVGDLPASSSSARGPTRETRGRAKLMPTVPLAL